MVSSMKHFGEEKPVRDYLYVIRDYSDQVPEVVDFSIVMMMGAGDALVSCVLSCPPPPSYPSNFPVLPFFYIAIHGTTIR